MDAPKIMDRIWSPWRYRYVSTAQPDDECIFCAKSAASHDSENYIVHRGERSFVILNLFPYTSGHLMVAPYEHVVVLTGYNETTVRYNNNGRYADVEIDTFLTSWGVLGNMALFHK